MANEPRITDPQRVRALAHPLRLELLDVLKLEGDATATRCAELTGESVASCSFHLRMLAKYGFVEEVERPGRQKPWRRIMHGISASADFDSPESVSALQEVSTFLLEVEAERMRGWIARVADEAPDWVEAGGVSTAAFWATPTELSELNAGIRALTEQFKERWDDVDTRPPGARVARLLSATSVDPADRRGAETARSEVTGTTQEEQAGSDQEITSEEEQSSSPEEPEETS